MVRESPAATGSKTQGLPSSTHLLAASFMDWIQSGSRVPMLTSSDEAIPTKSSTSSRLCACMSGSDASEAQQMLTSSREWRLEEACCISLLDSVLGAALARAKIRGLRCILAPAVAVNSTTVASVICDVTMQWLRKMQ